MKRVGSGAVRSQTVLVSVRCVHEVCYIINYDDRRIITPHTHTQILMSASCRRTTVIAMPPVPTHWEGSAAPVSWAFREMVKHV